MKQSQSVSQKLGEKKSKVVVVAPNPSAKAQPSDEAANTLQRGQKVILEALVKEQEDARKPVEIAQSLHELLSRFMHLKCWEHGVREFDHICVNKLCKFQDILLCSKCIIQDERHVGSCKNDLNSLEEYVPKKVEQLSGKREQEKLDDLKGQVNEVEVNVQQKIDEMRHQIEEDIKEITGSVASLCEELKKCLLKQVEQYEKEQKTKVAEFNDRIKASMDSILKEGKAVENEFKQTLTNNFDLTNKCQVSEFMKQVRQKTNKFAVENYVKQEQDELENFKFDLRNNQYYKRLKVRELQTLIYQTLQAPLQEAQLRVENNAFKGNNKNNITMPANLTGSQFTQKLQLQQTQMKQQQQQPTLRGSASAMNVNFKASQASQFTADGKSGCILDFERLNLQAIPKTPVLSEDLVDLLNCSDKKHVIVKLQTEEIKDPKISSQMCSVQQRALMVTDHKLPVNSLAMINDHCFATTSNDQKMKVWGFTQNYVIHLKASIQLPDLGLQIVFHKPSQRIFVAAAKGSVFVYDFNQTTNELVLLAEHKGHTRTVRNLAFLLGKLFTLSYDKTFKVWDISEQSSNQISCISSTDLPADEDCKFFEINQQYVIVGAISGNALVYAKDEQMKGSSELQEQEQIQQQQQSQLQLEYQYRLQNKVHCSKEKVTAIILGTKNPHIAYVGSGNGTITLIDLSNQTVIYKYRHLHKQRIASLNLFEDNYLLAISWDGIVNLYETNSRTIISTTKYTLANDEKKHSDGASAKIALVNTNQFQVLAYGNNDRQIQLFSLQLSDTHKLSESCVKQPQIQ